MSTTTNRPTFLVRSTAHVIAEEAALSHISVAEALTAHRLDLGQKLAAAVETADVFRGQGRPADWIEGEIDAARGYSAELLAIADLTAEDISAIVTLGPGVAINPADRCPSCDDRVCGGRGCQDEVNTVATIHAEHEPNGARKTVALCDYHLRMALSCLMVDAQGGVTDEPCTFCAPEPTPRFLDQAVAGAWTN